MKPLLSLFLFGCLTCAAQLPVIPMAFSTASVSTPQTLGANFWWVWTDVTNQSKVTNWVDRIGSSVWTNGNTATCPTPSSEGVVFGLAASVGMTNHFAVNRCLWSENSTHWVVISFTNNLSFTDFLDVWNTGALNIWRHNDGSLRFTVNAVSTTASGPVSTNRFMDIIYVSNKDAGANKSISVYTNGILATTTAGKDFLTGISTTTTNWNFLGGVAGDGFIRGAMKDVGLFATKSLTNAVDIAALHTALTNLYPGITP